MEYQAIARKWRPHKFEDLVGQTHVVQTLRNAISYERVGHAYLFCGARGVGKTSVARIFAKALRCPNVKDAIPCNECNECLSISESRSIDVVEIDGASNNGVEAVREIRENVAYGAATGKYKIYIIDEVHMLSISAFNALLKTLEEPPAHVIFMMATTEPQKIPLTILSRCQKFEFRRLALQEISERLAEILTSEGIQIKEEGLRIIATNADGSLRDALSLLDQVLSYHSTSTENEISEQQVVEALGVSSASSVRGLLSAILDEDKVTIIANIKDTYFSGVDMKHYGERILEELRLLYLVRLSIDSNETFSAELLDISKSHFKSVEELAQKANSAQLERMAQILSKAVSQLAWSSLPRFVLEMAAVRMATLKPLGKIENALSEGTSIPVAAKKKNTPNNKTQTVTTPSQAHVQNQGTSQPQPATANPSGPPNRPTPPPPANSRPAPHRTEMAANTPRDNSPQGTWRQLVDAVMKKKPILAALLTHANFKLEDQDGAKKVILAFPEDSFYEKQVSDTKYREDIDRLLKEHFGPQTTLALNNEMDKTHSSLQKLQEDEEERLKKEALEHPSVQTAQNVLGAELISVNLPEHH